MIKRVTLAILLPALLVPAVHAAGTGGCETFDFPVATELSWMTQNDVESVASGARLTTAPAKAMNVTLVPFAGVTFAVAPEGKAKGADGTFAGVITIENAGPPGLYQVSLSAKSWIDVVQNGKALKSGAHSGKSDCKALRKSVRFVLGAAPVTLQITGVATEAIKVTIRKAD